MYFSAGPGIKKPHPGVLGGKGLVGVSEKSQACSGKIDAVEKAVHAHLHAVAVAVGEENFHAIQLYELALRRGGAHVAVAPHAVQRKLGVSLRYKLRVICAVPEMDDAVGSEVLDGGEHIFTFSVGVGKNGYFQNSAPSFVVVNIIKREIEKGAKGYGRFF
jgi:hypothetical protein